MKRLAFLVIAVLAAVTLQAEETAHCPLCDTITNIDGELVSLDKYIGDVVLVVNTASKCGFTYQYRPLQKLYEDYGDRGFVVLGFPCNQFKNQEPGTDEEIRDFCSLNYDVSFPMFTKIDVNGDNAHPLYAYLTSDSLPIDDKGPVVWNFEKFLFDREGQVIARFRTQIEPDSEDVVSAIEKALGPSPKEEE